MGRLRPSLAAIAICGLLAVAFAPEAKADSCKSLLSQYQAVRALQIAMSKQVKSMVFDRLQRHTCSIAGLQLLDSYKAVLRKTIAAMDSAYPCNDASGDNGPRPNSG